MAQKERPVVTRMHPPKAPFDLFNRVVRGLLAPPGRARRLAAQVLVLHLTGRRTGRSIDVPVGYRHVGERLLVLTDAVWRLNLRDRSDVEVTVRGRLVNAQAELVEEPAAVARVYRELIAEIGRTAHISAAKAARRIGLRVTVDRVPTHEELAEAARRQGLSLVYLTVGST